MKDLVEAINKISTILETFFREYLIHFIISIILTVTLYYFIPTDNKILLKLGNFIFYGTAFLIFFLLIYIIVKIFERVKSNIYYAKQQKKYDYEIERKNIQEIRQFIDNLNRQERKLINYFLENDNKPLILQGVLYGNKILEYWCDQNEFEVDETMYAYNPVTLKEDYKLESGMIGFNGENISNHVFPYVDIKVQYQKPHFKRNVKYEREVFYTASAERKINVETNMNLNDIEHNINNMHKSLLRLANYFDGNEIAPFDELNIVSSNHFQKDLLNTKNEVSSEIKSREESIESRL